MKPPRWIGAAMIGAGAFGLTWLVSPRASLIALACAGLAALLILALASLASLIAAERADAQMEKLDAEEVERRGRKLSAKLRDELREQEAETAAAAVIGDDQ